MEEKIKKIIELLKQGNQSVFEQFYKLTKEKVFYNIFSILKNYSLSEDILQDTYITLLKNIDTLDTNKSIIGYLMTISRNLSLDIIRKQKINIELDASFYQIADSNNNLIKDEFLLKNIRNIINDKEMEILILHIFNDMTFQEIAQHKKRPLGTILWIYNNSIKKIKRRLSYEKF